MNTDDIKPLVVDTDGMMKLYGFEVPTDAEAYKKAKNAFYQFKHKYPKLFPDSIGGSRYLVSAVEAHLNTVNSQPVSELKSESTQASFNRRAQSRGRTARNEKNKPSPRLVGLS